MSSQLHLVMLRTVMPHRYESDETPMVEYLGLHHALHARRLVAQQGDFSKGPRVLVSLMFAATAFQPALTSAKPLNARNTAE